MKQREIDQSFEIAALMAKEVQRAREKYPAFNSRHEGYAVLLEEVDELWEEVKKNNLNLSVEDMRKEAIQIGAMAIRFIQDCCYPFPKERKL